MPHYNYKVHNEESLSNIVKELKRTTKSVEVQVEAIIEDGRLPINVRNNTILVRGLEYLSKFQNALREAHLQARQDAGDLDAEPRKVTKKAPRKKRK